jgi:hypothetical protein
MIAFFMWKGRGVYYYTTPHFLTLFCPSLSYLQAVVGGGHGVRIILVGVNKCLNHVFWKLNSTVCSVEVSWLKYLLIGLFHRQTGVKKLMLSISDLRNCLDGEDVYRGRCMCVVGRCIYSWLFSYVLPENANRWPYGSQLF